MLLEYAMKQIRELSLSAHDKLEKEINKNLLLTNYVETLIERAKDINDRDFHGANTLVRNPYPRTIRIAPSVSEMMSAVRRINIDLERINRSDMSAEDKAKTKRDMVREVIKPRKVITIKERPLLWWGDCVKGINLRPGLVNNDQTKCFPFVLGGNRSHVGAVGDTGEGKSVLMNAMIVAMLVEYPSWELNLTMNDGKMQEYAIYGQAYKCPQIRNIAITSSASYLESVYGFFEDEMRTMNDLYSKLGVKGMGALRDYLDMSVPAQLMVHDEFAQMKATASSSEISKIDSHMQAVAKLGRSNRYHLFPTSQELRGHIEGTVLGQFTIGIAAGTNEDNSKHMLGNAGATEIKGHPGYCIVNTNRVLGDPKENIKYKVAFMPDDTAEQRLQFQLILKRVCDQAQALGIEDEPTVYNEKDQMLFSQYEELVKVTNDIDKTIPRKFGEQTLTNVCLGVGTKYIGEKDTIIYFRWDYERKGNIFIHGQNISDIKYLMRLVGKALETSNVEIYHKFMIDNTELFEPDYVQKFKKDLNGEYNCTGVLSAIQARIDMIKYNNYCEEESKVPTISDYIQFKLGKNYNENHEKLERLLLDIDRYTQDDCNTLDTYLQESEALEGLKETNERLYNFIKNHQKEYEECLDLMFEYLDLMKFKKGTYLRSKDYPVIMQWFLDPRNSLTIIKRSGVNEEFVEILESGPSVGIFSIVVLTDVRDMKPMILPCKHELIGKPTSQFESNQWVVFKDESGIVCRYMQCDSEVGDYFKQFMIL